MGWPGKAAGVCDTEAKARWQCGTPRVLCDGSCEVLSVLGVGMTRGGRMIVSVAADAEPTSDLWSRLPLRGCTRELWGPDAGFYKRRVMLRLEWVWCAVVLRKDDPETLAAYVLRALSGCTTKDDVAMVIASELSFGAGTYKLIELPAGEVGAAA